MACSLPQLGRDSSEAWWFVVGVYIDIRDGANGIRHEEPMWFRRLFVLNRKSLAVESWAIAIQSTFDPRSDFFSHSHAKAGIPQTYIEPSESIAWKDMPPATRLTIRDPGIFTSMGYGTPSPVPFGMFFNPSLPFERWPHTKILGYLRPLYKFFHPDCRAVS